MKEINYKEEIDRIVNWIKKQSEKLPSGGVVVGISGGKDSYVVAKLCTMALGKDKVFGVLIPNGEQKDINDSLRVVKDLDISYTVVNINDAYKGLVGAIEEFNEINGEALINIPPRLRMTTLYSISQMRNAVVTCNGNRSEALVGYTTIYGDLAGAFAPIVHLHSHEVVELGLELGLITELVKKDPNDGLSGSTDEEKLGFSYMDVYTYDTSDKVYDELSDEIFNKIHRKNTVSEFKRTTMNIPSLERS